MNRVAFHIGMDPSTGYLVGKQGGYVHMESRFRSTFWAQSIHKGGLKG